LLIKAKQQYGINQKKNTGFFINCMDFGVVRTKINKKLFYRNETKRYFSRNETKRNDIFFGTDTDYEINIFQKRNGTKRKKTNVF
jgi:hypothetical protein